MAETNTIVFEAVPEVKTPEINLEGLSSLEIDMAKKQGVIKEEVKDGGVEGSKQVSGQSEKVDDKKSESDAPKGDTVAEINPEDFDTFEKIHELHTSHPDVFYKLPKSARNLYHNSKGLYKKAKEEEEKRKAIESSSELGKIKDSVASARLKRIETRLTDPDGLTIEELRAMIGAEEQEETSDRPLTRKDLEDIENKKRDEQAGIIAAQQRVQQRILDAESYAKDNIKELSDGKYEKIDDVVDMAKEVAAKKPRYMNLINQSFSDESLSEADVVEVIIDIAKLHPKWGETKGNGEKNVVADKAIKNSERQRTSASLQGGKGGRVVTHDELTPEDASNLTADQWSKLPKNVRDRILNQL